jgi:hypothetical protein
MRGYLSPTAEFLENFINGKQIMTKKKIEIINMTEADIVRLYPNSDAPKLSGIIGIQYSDDTPKFFQTMRSIVMIYIYLHNREQNLEVSKEYKKANCMAQPGAAGNADLYGTFHFTGTGATTWYGFARAIFALAASHGHPIPAFRPIATADYPTPAARPKNSVLDCSRLRAAYGIAAPVWQDSLASCVARLCEASLEVVA